MVVKECIEGIGARDDLFLRVGKLRVELKQTGVFDQLQLLQLLKLATLSTTLHKLVNYQKAMFKN